MTQAAKLRDALPAGTELNRSGMLDATGIPERKLDSVLYAFLARKEILTREKSGEPVYRINPDYKRSAGGGKAKGKKSAGKRGPKRGVKRAKKAARKVAKRVYRRRRAPKHATPPANGAGLQQLALDNLLAAGSQLRVAIRDQVTGLEDNEILQGAMVNHDRAEQILAATRSA